MPTIRVKPKKGTFSAGCRRFLPRARRRVSLWFRPRCPRTSKEDSRCSTFLAIFFWAMAGVALAGCSSSRAIGDVTLGAGGAVMGNQLSHGSAAGTAVGAAGGVLLNEGVHYLANKQSQKAYMTGYDKGRSDAVKQQYWLQVSQQREDTRAGHIRLYPVQLPEQRIDGVIFQPTTKYLRIEE